MAKQFARSRTVITSTCLSRKSCCYQGAQQGANASNSSIETEKSLYVLSGINADSFRQSTRIPSATHAGATDVSAKPPTSMLPRWCNVIACLPDQKCLSGGIALLSCYRCFVRQPHPNHPPPTAGFATSLHFQLIAPGGCIGVENLRMHVQRLDSGPRRASKVRRFASGAFRFRNIGDCCVNS